MIDYKYEYQEWIDSETRRQRTKKQFQKKFIGSRGYPHFDTLINLFNSEHIGKLQKLMASEVAILRWKFMPFVRKDQRNRRYRHKPVSYQPVRHRNQKKYTHIKSRPIMYASHYDACLFAFTNFILSKPYEDELVNRGLEKNVIAYRSIAGSNNVTYAKQAFDYMQSKDEFACLLIDIRGFFDNIPHQALFLSIEKILGYEMDDALKYIISNVTGFRYVLEDEVIKELKKKKRPYFVPVGEKAMRLSKIEDFNALINNDTFIRKNNKPVGFPQGSPISGLLANIFLMGFDEWLVKKIDKYSVSFYQRYSDDMLIVCPLGEVESLYNAIHKELEKIGLKLSTNKTELFTKTNGKLQNSLDILEPASEHKRENVQYLGLEWDGRQIILRPSTIGRRLRPRNKLMRKFWGYHELAIKKTGSNAIKKQFFRIRRTIRLHSK